MILRYGDDSVTINLTAHEHHHDPHYRLISTVTTTVQYSYHHRYLIAITPSNIPGDGLPVVGFAVGERVGFAVGIRVGFATGVSVGSPGSTVGWVVGTVDGNAVGGIGVIVGSPMVCKETGVCQEMKEMKRV